MPRLTDDQRQRLDSIKTPEDVIADDMTWADEHPIFNFSEYLKFDKIMARGLRRASDADKAAFVTAISDYLIDGIIPDFENMPPFAAMLSEHAIEGHKSALNKVYVDRYKQYLTGKLCGRDKVERST